MLSTAELLACHHDAKLLPAVETAQPIAASPARGRWAAGSFRPGLRVTVEAEAGCRRPATANWAGDDAVVITAD